MEEQKKKEEKEKVCPFSKDLKCENCRLYQAYPGSGGLPVCVFLRMND